jgi:small subunit ribosomal protein S7
MELKNYNNINLNKKINKFNSNILLSEKFINYLMLKGKKSTSESIFFNIFKLLQKISVKNIIYVIKFSLINSSVIISTYKIKNKKKRIIREIPFIISSKKRIFNAIKLSINFIRLEFKNNFLINYKNEIIKILKKNSDFLIKKDEIHSSALKNKAYAHFRWF